MQTSYKQLAIAAADLNSASDELGQVISTLDAALKKLNMGISAWVEISGSDSCPDNEYRWWSRGIGYRKVGDKWGIALRTLEGDHRDPDHDSEETWLFNDAPRWMRIEAIGKIPELLDRLLMQTEETTKTIKKKTVQASEIARAIYELAEESQSREQK